MFGITSFIGRLFGSDEAVSKIIDHTSSALDKIVYTSEEKADSAAKDVTEARAMLIDWLRNTQGQNLSRRVLALSIAFTWLSMYCFSAIMAFIAVWVPADLSAKCLSGAELVSAYSERLNGAVMLILAFYFAAPHMAAMIGPAMDKFSGGKK